MKSRVSLLLAAPAALAAQAPEAGQQTGPRATAGNGEAGAYDAVGIASVGQGEAMTAAHAQLPVGSVAEVTALDNGRIVLVLVDAREAMVSNLEIRLSSRPAQALGLTGSTAPVRVRSIRASVEDLAALRAGGSASPRLPAPEPLLRALRRQTPATPSSDTVTPVREGRSPPSPARSTTAAGHVVRTPAAKPGRPAGSLPVPAAKAPVAIRGGLLVQVAALRDERRARALARELSGRVEAAAGLWRVRLGPFADRVAAQRARDAAISRGYGDASIISAP